MPKKKRKRRASAASGGKEDPPRTPGVGPASSRSPGPAVEGRPRGSTGGSARSEERGARRTSGLGAAPPLGLSLVRGLAAVARSPVLLATAFLALLGFWGGLTAYLPMVPVSPAAMVLLLSLPPLHSFLDLQYMNAGASAAPVPSAGFGLAVIVVRALLVVWWVSLIRAGLEDRGEGLVGWPRRGLLRRARGIVVQMIGLEAGFLTLAILAQFLGSGLLGLQLGQLAILAVLLGGMHFLIFAPVAVVLERVGAAQAARLSFAAARASGPRHMFLTFGYLALTLALSSLAPGSRIAEATPSIAVWAYAMLVTFLHLSVLAAIAYRWKVMRALPEAELPGRTGPATKSSGSSPG